METSLNSSDTSSSAQESDTSLLRAIAALDELYHQSNVCASIHRGDVQSVSTSLEEWEREGLRVCKQLKIKIARDPRG